MGACLESFALLPLVGCSPMQRGFVRALEQVPRKQERKTAKGYRQVH